MCAAIGLRDIVGEAQDLFGVAIVPLHRDFDVDRDQRPGPQRNVCRPGGMENAGMQRRLRLVDVIDEYFDPDREREILFFAVTQIEQTKDRKSVVLGKGVSVRLYLGCLRIFKKKNSQYSE